MKGRVLLWFFFIVLLLNLEAHHIETFRLDHLTVSDGLPNSSVSAILQDDRGFMWFGTQAGLARYDGYNFKTYLNDPFDPLSLPHNLIQTMYMDEGRALWLGTYSGLSRLDLQTDSFTNYPSDESLPKSLSNDVVVAIARDARNRLWVGTLDGLNLLDEETGEFRRFFHNPEDPYSLPDYRVRSILLDNKGNLWIGTYGGLSRWDENQQLFINYANIEGDVNTIPSNFVMDIQQSPLSDDIILVGTWGGGVAEFNTVTKDVVRHEIPDMRVYKMLVDRDNSIWAGTWGGGLSVIDALTGKFNHFRKGSDTGLTHDIVYSLFEDQSGIIWIGTNGGGINKYVGWKNQYKFYVNDPENPFSIPSGKIISAYEDSQNKIWFGIQGAGVSRLNPETGLFRNYTHDENDNSSLSNPLVNVIYEDKAGNLWIGTNNGLNRYDEETDGFERIYASKEESILPEDLVYSMTEDLEGNLWLGTYTNGLAVKLAESGEFRKYENDNEDPTSLSDNLIRNLFVDSTGTVWICTNKGLNRFLPESNTFKRYVHEISNRSSISNNDVRKVFEDSDGDLWIATNGGGVNLYNRETDGFSLFTTADGLLSNSVLGIEEIEKGRLLFVTLSGISVYNKYEDSFTVIDEKTGLLSSELTSGFLKADDGSLYVGGLGGVTHIPVIEEQVIDYTPQVNINQFFVLGIPYDANGTPPWLLKETHLNYNENTLAFEFSLSEYSTEGKNQFAYKMEGVDTEWVYSGERNFARYADLDPGVYTFKVIGADSRNHWNIIGTELNILISPPFWRSLFAYISYFVLFILLILLAIFRIKRKQDEAFRKIDEQRALNIELENRVRKRTAQIEEARRVAEDATRAKSLFLANMSHELRTPLNAVVGFSELLNEEDYSPEKSHIITSIKTAGKSLSTLINDLLDLSKMEAGKMAIKTAPVNLSRVLFEVRHIFDLRIKEKKLEFILNIDPEIPENLMMDETRFRQILINLTGNAIKFTEKGHIRISTELVKLKRNGFIDMKMEISDTGCGITDKEKERIFDLFWQSESRDLNKPAGTGLGLSISRNLVNLMNGTMNVESSVGNGTVISILFRDMAIASIDKTVVSDSRGESLAFSEVKALVVDDIADNRNLLMEIMKQMNIFPLAAENGNEAIDLAVKEKPDIIFMDLQMPVKNGFAAAEEISQIKDCEEIPIIAVSAALESDMFSPKGMRTNFFSDYITKPYSIKSIKAVLGRYINHKMTDFGASFGDSAYRPVRGEIDDKENLLIKLEEFKEEWKNLKPSGRISRLETFAQRLREVSRRHNASDLVEYAEKLLSVIKVFDLKAIQDELARFPDEIKRISS